MEKTIGIIMILTFFTAIYYMIAKVSGWKTAIVIFFISLIVTAFLAFAVHLIVK